MTMVFMIDEYTLEFEQVVTGDIWLFGIWGDILTGDMVTNWLQKGGFS